MVQERLSGNASEKRNCWYRGHGPDSMRGELKRGAFPEQENTESESPASGEGCPSTRGL